jgi:hypothetical protein
MTTITSTYKPGQRVAIDIDGELFPGQITVSNTPGFWFAKLSDGTSLGQIAESRLVKIVTLRHNDYIVVLDAHRAQNHSVSSLSGYGKQYDDYSGTHGMARYMEALERNKFRGVWLNAEATVISAYREAPKPRHRVQSGDLVWFDSVTPGEGGWYRIALPGRMDGDHCSLIRA